MQHRYLLPTLLFLLLGDLHAQGSWDYLTPLPPGPRERAFEFVHGDKMYLGMGRSHLGYAVTSFNNNDVWTYDFATDTWTERDTFPGKPFRNMGTFVIGDTAYLVGGHDGTNYIDPFWKYHIPTDTWVEGAPFPGGALSWPVTFTIDGTGYAVTGGISSDQPGFEVYRRFLWAYDPATGQWTQRADLPGVGRLLAFGFVIDDLAYVGGGTIGEGAAADLQDVYRYDPSTDTWTEVASLPSDRSFGGYTAVIDGKGYYGEGARTWYRDDYGTDLWAYDPTTDAWTRMSRRPGLQLGSILSSAVAYDDKLYVLGGRTYSSTFGPYYDAFYVWDKDGPTQGPASDLWAPLPLSAVDSAQLAIQHIAPVSERDIWALPSAFLALTNGPLQVVTTDDGGQNWQTLTVDTTRNYSSSALFRQDTATAWLLATRSTTQSVLYRTTDGGQNWTPLFNDPDSLLQESHGVHFFDDQTGLLWGISWNEVRTVLYRTTDGGATWSLLDDPVLPTPGSWNVTFAPSQQHISEVVGDTVWIVTDLTVYRSADRGATWTALPGMPASVYGIAFEDSQRGMLIGDNYPGTTYNRVFRTEDGGDTWTELTVPSVPLAQSVVQISGRPGAYLFYSNMFSSNRMLFTPNYGQDWIPIHGSTVLTSMHFFSADVGFAGGPILPEYGQGIFQWQGDFDQLTPIQRLAGDRKSPYEVFPNPTARELSFFNPEGRHVTALHLLDTRGRSVLTRVVDSAQRTIRLDLGSVPPGLYLLQITDRQGQYTQRILKQ